MVCEHRYEEREKSQNPLPHSNIVLPVTYAIFDELFHCASNLRVCVTHRYATFSALFGTFSVVLAKILSELLTAQIEGVNQVCMLLRLTPHSDAYLTHSVPLP